MGLRVLLPGAIDGPREDLPIQNPVRPGEREPGGRRGDSASAVHHDRCVRAASGKTPHLTDASRVPCWLQQLTGTTSGMRSFRTCKGMCVYNFLWFLGVAFGESSRPVLIACFLTTAVVKSLHTVPS